MFSKSRMTTSIVVISSLMAMSASAQSTVDAEKNADKSQPTVRYLMIEESQWDLLADEPGHHLGRARDAFLVMDVHTAAAEVRKAAVHVRVAAENASENSKRALHRSVHELEQLAHNIETGTEKSVERFDLAASRALHALSRDQYSKSVIAWRNRELRRSGQYMRAAANNLEHAAAATEVKLRAATTEVARESRLISGKLIEGTGFVIDEVGSGFETLGGAIERFGVRVEPASHK